MNGWGTQTYKQVLPGERSGEPHPGSQRLSDTPVSETSEATLILGPSVALSLAVVVLEI